MDILKAFSLNYKNIEINIQGTLNDPLFQANQIGKILELKNIHEATKDFDNDEKVLLTIMTNGGMQELTFFSEIGLYKLLGRSKKPIAAIFQKWVFNTIKEIRINGSYHLKKDNEVDNKLLENKYQIDNHNNLIKAYDNKNAIYICKFKNMDDNKILIKIDYLAQKSNHYFYFCKNINYGFFNTYMALVNLWISNRVNNALFELFRKSFWDVH